MAVPNVLIGWEINQPIFQGVLDGALTPKAHHSTYGGPTYNAPNSTCHCLSAWFLGRLHGWGRDGSSYFGTYFYDYTESKWHFVGGSFFYTDTVGTVAMPAFFAGSDRIYVFNDREGPQTSSTPWHRIRANWASGIDHGASHFNYSSTRDYDRQFAKEYSTSFQDLNHVHDVTEYNGSIYLANSFDILVVPKEVGNPAMVWEIERKDGSDRPYCDDMCAKKFCHYASGDTEHLLCLFADGNVYKVGADTYSVFDIATVDPNISDGVDLTGSLTDLSIGNACYMCQMGNTLYAFLNSSGVGEGVVVYKSENNAHSWTEIVGGIPSPWSGTNAHIHGYSDPTNGQQRLCFIRADDTNIFGEFEFTGSDCNLLGDGNVGRAILGYDEWGPRAPDVEIFGAPVVDTEKAKIDFSLYSGASGAYQYLQDYVKVNIEPQYSDDRGKTWNDATPKSGYGNQVSGLDIQDAKFGGVGHSFYWDWRTDLGSVEHSGVMFRINTMYGSR